MQDWISNCLKEEIFPKSNKMLKLLAEQPLQIGETTQGNEARYIEVYDILKPYRTLKRKAEVSEYSTVRDAKDNGISLKIWFHKEKNELLKVEDIPEEYDSSKDMWSFYDKIYDNIFLNIEKSSLEFVYYKKYVRYYKTIENIKYGGEIDFNFSAEGKKSKFKNFNTIVEKDEACIDDSIKEKIYKLLKMIKKHHHSIENVSLMPSNGNMQFTKQSIGNDRFDVMAFAIDEYCKGNTSLLLAHCSPEYLKTLKRYMNDICYDKEQEKLVSKFYFEKIYNIRDDLGLINSIIESGKKAIDSAERVLEYMDLAYRVWICRLGHYYNNKKIKECYEERCTLEGEYKEIQGVLKEIKNN